MKTAALVLAAALMTGCAAPSERAIHALNAGNYQLAHQLATQAINEGDPAGWNNLGVVYQRSGQIERAVDAYTMGARYGVYAAQNNLAALNRPVPAADLAMRRSGGDDIGAGAAGLLMLGAFAQGYSQGATQPAAPRPPAIVQPAPTIKCTTVASPFSVNKQTETTCR